MESKTILSSGKRIDVHCHLFNKDVLSWRLIIDFVQSRTKRTTPYNAQTATASDPLVCSAFNPLKGIKRAANFLKIGMQSSSEDVYKSLLKTEREYIVVPLMFDLDYCMKGVTANEPDQNKYVQGEILKVYNQILLEDKSQLQQMKQNTDRTSSVRSKGAYSAQLQNNSGTLTDEMGEIDQLIQTIDSCLKHASKLDQVNRVDFANEQGAVIIKGAAVKKDPFIDQENQLIDLKNKYPNQVFPFYAVDPRRKENYKILKDGTYDLSPILNRLATNGGNFYGIKLYAPNGYSPADPMLMSLYKYCEDKAIPITAHCSGGGFASFAKTVNIQGLIYQNDKVLKHSGNITFKHYEVTDGERVKEKAQMLNHPLIWEKVLEAYPNLTLNLAHFGSTQNSEDWSQHIIRLMKKYPNLYTDFSCVSEKGTLSNMYKTYYSKADHAVKKRFLYGSDFYLNMLFTDDMKQYIDQFEKIFSANEIKEIMETNPKAFLKIDRKSEG